MRVSPGKLRSLYVIIALLWIAVGVALFAPWEYLIPVIELALFIQVLVLVL